RIPCIRGDYACPPKAIASLSPTNRGHDREERADAGRAPGSAPTGANTTEKCVTALWPRARKGDGYGRCYHSPAARQRRALRAPDPPLEPEDEALHSDRALGQPHHRPAAVAVVHRQDLRLRQGDGRPRR